MSRTLTIIPDFVPDNHPIRSHLPMAPKWITCHETANQNRGADAIMHGQYVKSPAAVDRSVLWHFTVDSDSIRQHLPVNEAGWHAGDGYNGPGNRESIGIEACVNVDGDFEATKRNVAWLVAHLKRTVPTLLPVPACVKQHNHWSGKECPRIMRSTPGAWDGLLALIKVEMEPPQPAPTVQLPNGAVIPTTITDQTMSGPVRAIVAGLGFTLNWDEATQQAVVQDYKSIPVRYREQTVEGLLIGGKTYVPIRETAAMLGRTVTWREAGPAVEITDPVES